MHMYLLESKDFLLCSQFTTAGNLNVRISREKSLCSQLITYNSEWCSNMSMILKIIGLDNSCKQGKMVVKTTKFKIERWCRCSRELIWWHAWTTWHSLKCFKWLTLRKSLFVKSPRTSHILAANIVPVRAWSQTGNLNHYWMMLQPLDNTDYCFIAYVVFTSTEKES